MPKATFPHVGPYSPAFKLLLEELGNEVILPESPSKQTLTLGSSHGPEFACLPLKIVLGSFIEALDKGADLILTSGGVGPCRAGLYASTQKEILETLGYSFEMVVLEPIRRDLLGLLKSIWRLNAARRSPWKIWEIVQRTYAMLQALDNLERKLHWTRPRELYSGRAEAAYQKGLQAIGRQRTLAGIQQAEKEALEIMSTVPIDPTRDPVRIGIVGEIYVLLEPASNLNIEKILGELEVEVHRSIFLTGWTQENVVREGRHVTAGEVARPYLGEMIGGHGQESVGHTIMYADEGMDGVIQLAPFTCIPEIVAKAILPKVSQDKDIPVISFFLDEQTGEAGFRTRLEAFVDLLKRRRIRQQLA